MKKIMFNDKYRLTKAVLEGRKTMTRRNTDLYKVGEVVAIAQSYYDVCPETHPIWQGSDAGRYNKMFVKAECMPHHIRILSKRQERLQDISEEDCLKEGVLSSDKYASPYGIPYTNGSVFFYYSSPREAFTALINNVSGKGTWESNPLVWVYSFELVD